MPKHRSLSNALSPERLAFIKGDAHKKGDLAIATENLEPKMTADSTTNSFREPLANDEYLVAVTTRLHADTAEALRQAHLKQKLSRQEPATQQDIIETALRDWLGQHGYGVGSPRQ